MHPKPQNKSKEITYLILTTSTISLWMFQIFQVQRGSWIWTCKSLDLPWFEVKTLSQEFAYFILTTSNNNSFTSKSGLWFFQNPPKSKVKKWGPPFLKILSSSTEKKSVWQKINNNSLVLKLIFPKFATQQGAPGFEPGTSWSAVKCSTTELYPHEIEIIT